MRNIKVIFQQGNPKDPLAAVPTVAVRAEIKGEKYGVFTELNDGQSATEVCEAIQLLLDILMEAEDRRK